MNKLSIRWINYLKIGDYLVIIFMIFFIIYLINFFWKTSHLADQVKISAFGQHILTENLNQNKTLKIQGKLGVSVIQIDSIQKRVRIIQDPSPRQYCVAQGWLIHAQDIAICLPNQISVELINRFDYQHHYDSVSY